LCEKYNAEIFKVNHSLPLSIVNVDDVLQLFFRNLFALLLKSMVKVVLGEHS
jgi:hypothetical protein